MYPTLFNIGPIPIHSYGLMLALGFLVTMFLCRRDAPKFGFDPDVIADGAFWTLLLGIIGTRILFIMMFPEQFSWSNPLGWFAVWQGGLVFQGAIPPVFVFLIWFTRRHKMGLWNTIDVVIPYIALGHGIGRLGCFFNGCCYGRPTDLPWGISFPRVPFDVDMPLAGCPVFVDHLHQHLVPETALWSLPIHPTQLYGTIGLVSLCFILLYIRNNWRPFHGVVACAYFVSYGIGRFFVEMIRADDNPVHIANLTDQQVMALAAVVAGIVLFFVLKNLDLGNRAKSAAKAGAAG